MPTNISFKQACMPSVEPSSETKTAPGGNNFARLSSQRKPLVDDAGVVKTIMVMAYCHLSVSLLCINVMFDLFLFGIPTYVLRCLGVIPVSFLTRMMTGVISWTTPIVFFMPMVASGSKIFCDNIPLLLESKEQDSLLLANHGSRIDWMVAMFCGYVTKIGGKSAQRSRVGFVCEAILQFMPLIGWYRKIICDDIFVWRSFKQDASTIQRNISRFKTSRTGRMLFLSPEGIVVDFGPKDRAYIESCREFCIQQGFEPFDYVLTPRYKGTSCLVDQIKGGGTMISICIAYVRDGKLLNCKISSDDRVVPDIYLLTQGIGGKPIDIYISLTRLSASGSSDMKLLLMKDYKRKDELLANWHKQIAQGMERKAWTTQFTRLDADISGAALSQLLHGIVIIAVAAYCGHVETLLMCFMLTFFTVSACHTFGWLMNSSSMESIPFETGIKALIGLIADSSKSFRKKLDGHNTKCPIKAS